MDYSITDTQKKYQQLFGPDFLLVRSPARINLIGEHTDYNDGFVMPAAIDRETMFAIGPSSDGTSVIHATMYNESFTVDITNPLPVSSPKWANYLLGVLKQFLIRGHSIKPFSCVFGGNIPLGAGLSSSASVECGFAFALNTLNDLDVPRIELIKMAQWAEHNYAGVKCGIMDQFASMMGAANQVIVLDCRSLEYSYSPLELTDYAIVLCDTKVKHSLVDSEYNTRRSECEQGVAILQKHYSGITSLRDVSEAMVVKHRDELPGKVFDRCLYIVQEIDRVQKAGKDLKAHDLEAFGKKMFETHEGLSKRYEVSCPELDFLVEQAKGLPGVIGARMMGGGFGGCTINLVKRNEVESFVQTIRESYKKTFAIDMDHYVVKVSEGTGLVTQAIGKIALL